MRPYLLPPAFTIFLWWFGTGVILYFDGLRQRTFKWTMAGASVVCGMGLVGLSASSAHTSVAAAYCAFTCALLALAGPFPDEPPRVVRPCRGRLGFALAPRLVGAVGAWPARPSPPQCAG